METHQFEDVEQLIELLNERETFFINKFKAANPNYGYNVKPSGTVSLLGEPKLCRLCDAYYHQYMQNIWPFVKMVEEKVLKGENLNEEEQEFYQEYFVDKNAFYKEDGSHKTDEFICEHWIEFAEFCTQDFT